MVLVAGVERGAALMHAFLGLPPGGTRWAVELQAGGISVVDLPWSGAVAVGAGQGALEAVQGTVHCMNSRSHLGAALGQGQTRTCDLQDLTGTA